MKNEAWIRPNQRRGRGAAPARLAALLVAVALLMLGSPREVAGQPASATLDQPTPAECQIAPIDWPIEILDAPEDSAPPERFEPPAGEAPEAAAAEAVLATIRESVACANAGAPLRAMALFSERYLANLFTGPDGQYDVSFEERLPRAPTPAPKSAWLGIVSVENLVLLDGGRIGAAVRTSDGAIEYRDYLWFVEADGRWLIDDLHAISAEPVDQSVS